MAEVLRSPPLYWDQTCPDGRDRIYHSHLVSSRRCIQGVCIQIQMLSSRQVFLKGQLLCRCGHKYFNIAATTPEAKNNVTRPIKISANFLREIVKVILSVILFLLATRFYNIVSNKKHTFFLYRSFGLKL